jgi:hypothetical protein
MTILTRRSHHDSARHPPRLGDTGEAIRVLIEHPDPTVRDILVRNLQDRGYAALACGGPQPDADGAVSCPLLHQEHCPAVDGADIIVNGLPIRQEFTRLILHRAREQHPDLPVILEAPDIVAEAHDLDLADAHLYPMSVERLTLLIDTLVGD